MTSNFLKWKSTPMVGLWRSLKLFVIVLRVMERVRGRGDAFQPWLNFGFQRERGSDSPLDDAGLACCGVSQDQDLEDDVPC